MLDYLAFSCCTTSGSHAKEVIQKHIGKPSGLRMGGWCQPTPAGLWSGLDHDCVTGKVVDKNLQSALVALVCSRGAQTCPQRPMAHGIWYLFLIKASRAIIAVVLQWKPHLPQPLTLPPTLFPGLRLSWSPWALSSVPPYPGPVHLLALFLASSSSLWGINIAPYFFFTCKYRIFRLSFEKVWLKWYAVQWPGSWNRQAV